MLPWRVHVQASARAPSCFCWLGGSVIVQGCIRSQHPGPHDVDTLGGVDGRVGIERRPVKVRKALALDAGTLCH